VEEKGGQPQQKKKKNTLTIYLEREANSGKRVDKIGKETENKPKIKGGKERGDIEPRWERLPLGGKASRKKRRAPRV